MVFGYVPLLYFYIFCSYTVYETDWDPNTKSGCPDFQSILTPLVSPTPIQIQSVQFSQPPNTSLLAPITEVLVSTLKPNVDLMKFGEVCRVTCEDTIEFGCLGTAWGYVKEDPRRVVLLFGWESVEVNRFFIRGSRVLVLIVYYIMMAGP
jgi:hypothetical protein